MRLNRSMSKVMNQDHIDNAIVKKFSIKSEFFVHIISLKESSSGPMNSFFCLGSDYLENLL